MSGSNSAPLTVRMGRYALQLPLLGWLVVVWILLHGEVTVLVVVTGTAVAVLILLVFRMPAMDYGLRLRPLAAAWFVLRFLFDLVLATLRVAVQILGPRPSFSVLAIQLRAHSDMLLTATAITVSAIPGTVVLDVDRSTWTLWIHALGAADDAATTDIRNSTLALEHRITRAFGTRADIARVTAPVGEGSP